MIKEFVQAWDARKDNLARWFRGTKQEDLSYEAILKAIIDEVLNPFFEKKLNSGRIHTIDDGKYQGCQLFIVPIDTYQPSPYEYIITYQDYGSCSGCDLLESIRHYEDIHPTEEQVRKYMMLALHLLQRCRYFMDSETYFSEE